MGPFMFNEASIDGDVYIQRLATYVRRNEEALANGLLCFSKNKRNPKLKPLRLNFTIHHLYYITDRIENSGLGVDVGPLNIKLDNPNHEPTFISFMANNAKSSSKQFDSDTRSITSMNSMRSIVSSASTYWRNIGFTNDPKIIKKNLKYLYSSFTKIPCLVLTPNSKISNIASYEEYPCDTSVPMNMFKNLQVLEIVDYEPNEIFGWHILSEQLRILIIKSAKVTDLAQIIYNLVIDDECGRSSFGVQRPARRQTLESNFNNTNPTRFSSSDLHRLGKRERSHSGAGSLPSSQTQFNLTQLPSGDDWVNNVPTKDYQNLPDAKWGALKQLTVSQTSITYISGHIFKPLHNLVKLNLSNNLLEELPQGLGELQNIKFLNLSDNYITNLRNIPSTLKQLSTINLNNNKIEDLTGIENLCTLEKIDLRRNKLADVKSLKPLVLQFMKNPDVFKGVYLSNNKLSKNYRVELFNLFNGVQYKNSMKIDDSKPGYFESALLVDADSASKNLEAFLGGDNKNESKTPSPITELKDSAKDLAKELAKDQLSLSTPNTPTTILHIVEPLNNLKFDPDNKHDKKKPEMRQTSLQQLPSVGYVNGSTQANSCPISPLRKKSLSPLGNNLNRSNQTTIDSSLVAKPTRAIQTVTVNSTSSIHQVSQRSATLAQLDLDNSTSNGTAPNIITPVKVTVRMST